MDREQIIRWAFEADMEGAPANDDCRAPHFVNVIAEELEAFAKLVRDDYSNKHAQLWLKRIDEAVKAEREECAKACELTLVAFGKGAVDWNEAANACAAAIRARST